MDHVIHFATTNISKGIAAASEAIAHRKGKTAPRAEDSYTDSVQDDQDGAYVERQWALDDYVNEIDPNPSGVDAPPGTVEELSQSFVQSHQLASNTQPNLQPLPMPVIIPQRRPRDRSRGFVRAYAPMLNDAGIAQDVFLDFLNDFDKASKASPVFDVINIACMGIGMVPSTICLAVSASVSTVNEVAQELQRRYKSNKFLDEINEALYKPRGLLAMVMTYKPDMADEAFIRVDTTANENSLAVYKTLSTSSDPLKIKERLRRLRISSGSATEASIPESAPLVYPSLDIVVQSESLAKKTPGSVNLKSPVVQDYLDRRAQADFSHHNPDSKLAQVLPPSKPHVNRFADPDHPVNSGSIFGLVTGGKFDPIAAGRVRRAEAAAKKRGDPPLTAEERHNAYMGRRVRGRVTGTPSKDLPVIGKILKKDVLYLTVVNLPSQEEMDRIKKELENN